MKKNSADVSYAFFGSATFSICVLDELEKAGMPPALIVTTPDKPAGRGLALTPTAVKVWGRQRGIPVLDPAKLDATFAEHLKKEMKKAGKKEKISCFVVAAYGKIIPQTVLDIPPRGTLNVHPSLLPRYRGATPLQSAMLDDAKNTGVTVMLVDAAMDHGPIVAQKPVAVDEWPVYEIFEETMAREGGWLLAHTLPDWIAGNIAEKNQDHAAATVTKKIAKEDGLIEADMRAFARDATTLSVAAHYEIFRKIQAYHHWPTAYFFVTNKSGQKIRVKITQASWRDGRLVIEKVIPEGKKETDFAAFVKTVSAI